eukprot:3071921-Pleurochrysis_carterae.AAC.1
MYSKVSAQAMRGLRTQNPRTADIQRYQVPQLRFYEGVDNDDDAGVDDDDDDDGHDDDDDDGHDDGGGGGVVLVMVV